MCPAAAGSWLEPPDSAVVMWPGCMSDPCMAASRVHSLTLAGLCCLCAGAVLLLRVISGNAASWIPVSWASQHPTTCPPYWQPGANENGSRQDTYQRCLARHGRELHTGYSLKCADIFAAFMHMSTHADHSFGFGTVCKWPFEVMINSKTAVAYTMTSDCCLTQYCRCACIRGVELEVF